MGEGLLEHLAPHLVVGVEGAELTARERELLAAVPPAGVILFSENVIDMDRLRRLTGEIDSIITTSSGRTPLIAADHEGGRISVLHAAIGAPPSQMAIGCADPHVSCREVYRETARRLRLCGVNTLLAPVADVNLEYLNPIIGVRSFGEDRSAAARLVVEAVDALRHGGVCSCLKHFPGHGSSRTDSHCELPYLPFTLGQLREREMEPFFSGIGAGADTVMMGHIAPWGRPLPASLDGEVIAMLREDLGFEGVVMTDALEMAGVRALSTEDEPGAGGERSLADIAERALLAGNDILLFSRPYGEIVEEIAAQGSGAAGFLSRFPGEVRAAAVERIRRLRGRAASARGDAGAQGRRMREAGRGIDDAEVYRSVARHAVRVVGPREPRLAVGAATRNDLVPYGERDDFENGVVARFVRRLAACLEDRTVPRSGPDENAPFTDGAMRSVLRCGSPESGRTVEIVTPGPPPPASSSPIPVFVNRRPQTREAFEILCAGAELAVVAGWPYAARLLPTGTAAIVTYGAYDAAVEEVYALITGERSKTD